MADLTSKSMVGPDKMYLSEREMFLHIAEVAFEKKRRERPTKYFVPNGAIEKVIEAVGTQRDPDPPHAEGKWIFILAAANSLGKCLTLDTRVLMSNGEYKTLDKIHVGDVVMGYDINTGISEPTTVINKWNTGIKKIYKTTFKDGTFVRSSGEHRFPIKLRSGRNVHPVLRSIDSIKNRKYTNVGGKLKFKQPRISHFTNEYGKLPIHPYLLGALIGDGSLGKDNLPQNQRTQFTNQDVNVINRVRSLVNNMGCNFIQTSKITYNISGQTGKCGSNPIRDGIINLRLSVCSHDKFIPTCYKTASHSERLELLAGLIDTDGTRWEYTTVSDELAKDFCWLVRSVGGFATMKKKKTTWVYKGVRKYSTTWKCYWNIDYSLPLSIPKKQHVKERCPIEYTNKFVESIAEDGYSECADITVDNKSHCFIVEDFVATHNSAGAIAMLDALIWGPPNKFFDYTLFKKWPFPKKFWYISEVATLKDFICGSGDKVGQSEIAKWFPEGRYTMVKDGKDYYSKFMSDNGWSGSFKSFDQDPTQFESDKIGCIILDEPPPQNLWSALLARLTLGGIVIMPMTPLFHAAWVKDELIDKAGDEGSGVYVLEGDVEMNCKTHGRHGRLEHAQIVALSDFYDEDDKEARLHGKFMHLSGMVFKGIHPEKHRHHIPPHEFNQKDYRIYQVLDPHDARPSMAGWFAVDKYDHVYAVDEYPKSKIPFHLIKNWTKTTLETVEEFRSIEIANGWIDEPIIRIIDPNFGNRPVQQVGMTVAEWFHKVSVDIGYPISYITNVNDALEQGHRAIRDYLKLTPDGETRFQIGDSCPNIWYHLTHYSRKENTGKALETKGQNEGVNEKYKDGVDLIRYFFQFMRKPYEAPVPDKVNNMDEHMERAVFSKIRNKRQQSINTANIS